MREGHRDLRRGTGLFWALAGTFSHSRECFLDGEDLRGVMFEWLLCQSAARRRLEAMCGSRRERGEEERS